MLPNQGGALREIFVAFLFLSIQNDLTTVIKVWFTGGEGGAAQCPLLSPPSVAKPPPSSCVSQLPFSPGGNADNLAVVLNSADRGSPTSGTLELQIEIVDLRHTLS